MRWHSLLMLGLLPALAGVSGCATGGDFPSLAPRAVERLSMEEPVRIDPVVARDPAVVGQAEALLGEARRGDAAFEAAFSQALPRVRASGPANSDTWVQAQEAISRVEIARVESVSALGRLDALLVERADDPTNLADFIRLTEAHRAAAALVADQQRRLDGLLRSVSRP